MDAEEAETMDKDEETCKPELARSSYKQKKPNRSMKMSVHRGFLPYFHSGQQRSTWLIAVGMLWPHI